MSNQNKYFWLIVFIYLVTNSLAIYYNILLFFALPIAAISILLVLYDLRKTFFLIAVIVAPSVGLSKFTDLGFDLYIPSEILLIGITFLFIFKTISQKLFEKNFIKHPLTLLIILYLFWIFLTSFASELPVVSFKFLISKIWFVVPAYFFGFYIFYEKTSDINKFIGLYSIGLTIMIIYTIINVIQGGIFDKHVAHFAVRPFYQDHTSYGANIAFMLPAVVALIPVTRQKLKKTAYIILSVLFLIALVLSYSRAAWLSIIFAFFVAIVLVLKIKLRFILSLTLILILTFFVFEEQIYMSLISNKQASSDNLVKHVESITNIRNDESNLERINRWKSAIRLFKERPFTGWGPGTYAFVYAPFQMSRDKTSISTNHGDLGNAHSEYLGALSEMGFIGMLIFIAIVIVGFITGVKTYKQTTDKQTKILILGLTTGLSTYYFHALLNNFLDTDKLSLLFWSFYAAIVALDIKTQKKYDI